MLAKIAWRLGNQIDRALEALDSLENRTEDPDIATSLFMIDHLITQTRGDVDALLVLGGRPVRQLGRDPALAYGVCREALQEITEFRRVYIPVERQAVVQVNAYARSAVVRILAILLSNATTFSDPGSSVTVTSTLTPEGLTIEIVDEGLGFPADELAAANDLLARSEPAQHERRLDEGRNGLVVVAKLAASFELAITLHANAGKGTTARVNIPHGLLLHPGGPGAVQHTVLAPATPRPNASTTPASPPRPVATADAPRGPAADPGNLPPLPQRTRSPHGAAPAGGGPHEPSPTVGSPDPGRMQAFRSSTAPPETGGSGTHQSSP
jgi:hypothetical protein